MRRIVLYDHLITDEILALIPSETRKIYVGKTEKLPQYQSGTDK